MTPAAAHRRRARIGFAVRAALALGLLALAVHMNRAEIRGVLARRIDGGLFARGLACYLAGLLLAYARWFLLVRALGIPFQVRDALRLGFIGALFNFVIPGAIGGDFVRAAFLCRERPALKPQAIASVVVDRLVGLLGLFGLAAATGTLAWSQLHPDARNDVAAAWTATAVVAAILVIAFIPALHRPLARRLARRKRAIAEGGAVGAAYHDRLGVVALGAVMATTTHALNVLAFYTISRALFPSVPGLAEHLVIVPLVLFSTAIPLPFGAAGVSEQVSFKLLGVASYTGGAVAMMGFKVLQLCGALIGAAVYAARAQQVRALLEEAEHLDDDLDLVPPLDKVPS